MTLQAQAIHAIPTNIITGFLGVGKTTAILHLLKSKPNNERWAVLVNEFGEIGVDGSLFKGQNAEENGVFIREVPGGCMCCAAGLPMQIALNQLLSRAKPQRLLIEPTGLGHPKEVLEILGSPHYQNILDIQHSVTLVDARKLHDSRYTNHATFNQQINIADVIVGNKQDLYLDEDKALLEQYIAEHSKSSASVFFTSQGQLDPTILYGSSKAVKNNIYSQEHSDNHHLHESRPNLNEAPIPECGHLKVQNSGEGYQSTGWRFAPHKIFDRKRLYDYLTGLKVERMKAVFITPEGIFGYNATENTLTESELDDCLESRIEIITRGDQTVCEKGLLACLVNF